MSPGLRTTEAALERMSCVELLGVIKLQTAIHDAKCDGLPHYAGYLGARLDQLIQGKLRPMHPAILAVRVVGEGGAS